MAFSVIEIFLPTIINGGFSAEDTRAVLGHGVLDSGNLDGLYMDEYIGGVMVGGKDPVGPACPDFQGPKPRIGQDLGIFPYGNAPAQALGPEPVVVPKGVPH